MPQHPIDIVGVSVIGATTLVKSKSAFRRPRFHQAFGKIASGTGDCLRRIVYIVDTKILRRPWHDLHQTTGTFS
jgi:hypothetical protein